MDANQVDLSGAGNKHQYSLNTIKVPKNERNYQSFDVNNNDVASYNQYSTDFTTLNNKAYQNQHLQSQIPRFQSQAEMYDKMNYSKPIVSRRITQRNSMGVAENTGQNFKSSSQLQNVYNSITPSNNRRFVSQGQIREQATAPDMDKQMADMRYQEQPMPMNIPPQKEQAQLDYAGSFEPMNIGGTIQKPQVKNSSSPTIQVGALQVSQSMPDIQISSNHYDYSIPKQPGRSPGRSVVEPQYQAY